ncbi:MAG TPA: hypothetical protein PLF92_10705 [Arenimonas sp.]|nr:hypothetical protein [Arenimonas sp.]HOZ05630.1 hypothetical protein [Arenimonas sp.]HPO24297.1 hypothetical protein [Arenimonas sp.]HPW33364.1 hypothetical protein [Arenimonas sp.]
MNSHDDISNKSRALFEHSVATLDVATANRLRLMRRDTLSQKTPSRLRTFLIPISASLAIALGIALFLPQFQTSQAITEQDTVYISTEDDADADMLTWLADAPVNTSFNTKGSL